MRSGTISVLTQAQSEPNASSVVTQELKNRCSSMDGRWVSSHFTAGGRRLKTPSRSLLLDVVAYAVAYIHRADKTNLDSFLRHGVYQYLRDFFCDNLLVAYAYTNSLKLKHAVLLSASLCDGYW